MARFPGVPEDQAGMMARYAYRTAKKKFGQVPEPMAVIAHHPWIFRGYGAFEFSLDKARTVNKKLKSLASIKAATMIGCPF